MHDFIFSVSFLALLVSGCVSEKPAATAKPAAEGPAIAVCSVFMREELMVPGGLQYSARGDVLAYAKLSLVAKAENLCGQEVYLKMTIGDNVLRDIEERELLDETAKKVGNYCGLSASFAGWETHCGCTIIRRDPAKHLLVFRVGNHSEELAVLFFGEKIPEGKTFRIITVTAGMDLRQDGDVVGARFVDGIARIEVM